MQVSSLRQQGRDDEVKSIRESYVARTRQMALNVGKEKTLGTFLNQRFPEK